MSLTDTPTSVRARPGSGQHVRATGVELVALAERFYQGLFGGLVAFVGLACVAALAVLPFRDSATSGIPITAIVTGVIALITPLALRRLDGLYRLLRERRSAEYAVVALAAALVAYPLRSELWWPSCALLMLLAIIAPLWRTLLHCLVVLVINLAAHAVAGDLEETPVVAILGLWVGYPFWVATLAVVGDRFAAHILRLQTTPAEPSSAPPLDVDIGSGQDPVTTDHSAEPCAAPAAPGQPSATPADGAMSRLTARQLEVTALLVHGLRYAEIAACLSISERQVQRHVSNAIGRTGVHNVNSLVAIAIAEGLVPGE